MSLADDIRAEAARRGDWYGGTVDAVCRFIGPRGMTFDEFTERTVPRKTPDGPPLLWAAGLGGEAAEVMEAAVAVVIHAGRAQDAVKKLERDGVGGANMRGEIVDRDEELRKECGNVLFYLDRLLRSRGMSLEGAALAQIEAMA